MLTTLALTAFKAWKSVEPLRLAPVTGLFGANSSGKTSLLQAILLLKQTAESPDRAQVLNLGDERSHVSLGLYRDVVWGRDPSRGMGVSLTWRPSKPIDLAVPGLDRVESINFEVAISSRRQGAPTVEEFGYRTNVGLFGMKLETTAKNAGYELQIDAPGFTELRRQGRPTLLPAPVKCYDFPDQLKVAYQNLGFLGDLALGFEEMLGRVYYLGPLREDPRRDYSWSGGAPDGVGRQGERWVDALLASRDRGRPNQRGPRKRRISVEEHVAQWLKELGLIHSFSVKPLDPSSSRYKVEVQKSPGSDRVLITDVGFGVSQVMPVLVLLAYAPRGSTVILEQPEIHLHPAVQLGLADVVIEAATVRGVQVILESHSEHLLQRLQRRVAEGTLSRGDAALYFCELTGQHSRAQELHLDLSGNITNWPADLFGNPLAEAGAMAEAALRRRQAG